MEAIDFQLAYNSVENQSFLNNFPLNGSTVIWLPPEADMIEFRPKCGKPFWLLVVTVKVKKQLSQ